MYTYTYTDWKDFTKAFKLSNKMVSEILGLTPGSVNDAIGKKKPLPKWANGMVWAWKNTHRGNV
jgi:hypothetical protein